MKHTALIIAFSVFAMSAFAGDRSSAPNIDKRIAHQEQRIDRGVAKGEISPGEATVLKEKTAAIKAETVLAKKDGHVSKGERMQIHHDLNGNGKHIKKTRHHGHRKHRIQSDEKAIY